MTEQTLMELFSRFVELTTGVIVGDMSEINVHIDASWKVVNMYISGRQDGSQKSIYVLGWPRKNGEV